MNNSLKYINLLSSVIDSKINRYEYNLARYLNRLDTDLRNYAEVDYGRGTTFSMLYADDDMLSPASTNVIKSVIDSLVSKLANNKTRPYFTPVNGTYKTRKVVKQIQSFFDTLFDDQDVHSKISKAFKEACIFDIGYLFLNPFTWELETADTWTVGTLCSERNKKTKLLIKRNNYPATLLQKYKLKQDYVQVAYYIDTVEHKAEMYINAKLVESIKYDSNKIPLVEVYFNEPVNGNRTVSVVEELDGIQTQIDLINAKISQASQLTPANTTYVYENSSLKSGDISNRTGTVYAIDMPPGSSGLPVVTETPAIFDPQWLSMLDYYKSAAYEMVGISQLSAQSKKPSGLNSGTALQTMEDIESDRFETQVTHYINAYIDLSKLYINVVPEEQSILPESENVDSLKWKEVRRQSDLFKIQYSAESSLSKDPAEKVKQIMEFMQMGLVPPSKVAHYMDMPDLQDVYSGASAVQDGIETVIERAIEEDKYIIPEFVNYQQLAQEIAQLQNQLFSCIDNKESKQALDRLNKLDQHLQDIMQENGYIDLTPAEDQQNETTENGMGIGQTNQQVQAISSTVSGVNTSQAPETEEMQSL